jgi:hypothetical protein
VNPILGATTLLLADNRNRTTSKRPKTGDYRGIVGVGPITVDLDPVLDQSTDEVQGVRSVGMASDQGPLPTIQFGVDVSGALLELPAETLQLAASAAAGRVAFQFLESAPELDEWLLERNIDRWHGAAR